MKAITMRVGIWMLLGILTLSFGCAQPKPDRPKTYPVSGTVTYKGEPVADANLNFQLADGSGYAMAKTDAAGKYQLTTFEAGDGAVPGEYRVGVTKYEAAAAVEGASVDDASYVPPAEGEEVAPAKSLLPEKYSNPGISGLTATVTEAGPNTFDFELVD